MKINNKKNYEVLGDITIRAVTIIIRGIFIFAAAKYLNEKNFGSYVAIAAVISLLQYAVAGDFSYIAHREFFSNRIKLEEILKTQSILMITLFLICVPIAWKLLPMELERDSLIMGLIILLLESLTSELQRHLVAISRFTSANIILFLKSAGWMLPTMVIFNQVNNIEVELILYAWMSGLIISTILALIFIRRYLSIKVKINKDIIILYIRTVAVIILGTLAARALFSIDRTFIEKKIGVEDAGIYGLFIGIAAGYVAVVDSGILSRAYPTLITLGTSKNENETIKKVINKINLKIITITVIAIIIYYTFIEKFLNILNKSAYIENAACGIYLIIGYGIYSLSFPLNCLLYSRNKDKTIMIINVVALLPMVFYAILNNVTLQGMSIYILISTSLHYVIRKSYLIKWQNY